MGAFSSSDDTPQQEVKAEEIPAGLKVATFGGGCFWCVEAVFLRIKGVHSVKSGYAGGHVKKPTYEDICTGESGHAEVIQIYYDEEQVSFEKLLEIFWLSHDPTTLNRQGMDIGTQYRSTIMYHSLMQKKAAEAAIEREKINFQHLGKIVTEVVPLSQFHNAEGYHQDFYAKNPSNYYCRVNVAAKL